MSNQIRSRYVMTNGVRTHYWETGDNGPVIVALHGGGAGSSCAQCTARGVPRSQARRRQAPLAGRPADRLVPHPLRRRLGYAPARPILERFHCCCVPAKFCEEWLFFTEEPLGQWRSVIYLQRSARAVAAGEGRVATREPCTPVCWLPSEKDSWQWIGEALYAVRGCRLLRWPLQWPRRQMDLTIDSNRKLATMPRGFLGLSYESAQLADPAFFSASNTTLVRALRDLSPRGVL